MSICVIFVIVIVSVIFVVVLSIASVSTSLERNIREVPHTESNNAL